MAKTLVPQVEATMLLSRSERAQLTQCEDVLATARRWAIEEAKALLAVRDRRLYRANHATFEAYAQARWGMERAHAYRLCAWAEVMEALSPNGCAGPQRESHARPLIGLTVEQQRRAWRAVQRRHRGAQTAGDVEVAAREVLTPPSRRPAASTIAAAGVVVCGDAIVEVSKLRDGTVDLVLFSPPYTNQRDRHYPGVPEAEYVGWMTRLMSALRPKLTVRGSVMIVAREHLHAGQISDVWLRTRLAVREANWIEPEELVWFKPDAPPTGRADRPRRTWERILWFSTTTSPFTDLRACGTPLVEDRARLARPRRKGLPHTDSFARFRCGDVARVTDMVTATVGSIAAGVDHPAMYPQSLADQLIRTYSPVEGLVVDPCCGSGTTLLAARDAGRRWWGSDIKREYATAAQRRLRGV